MDQELIDADTTVGDIGPARSVPLGYVEVATSVTDPQSSPYTARRRGTVIAQWYSAGLVI